MFKKIIVATLLAIMITGLVYGAWYRTQARTVDERSATNEQHREQTSELAQGESGFQQGSGNRGADDSQDNSDLAVGEPDNAVRGRWQSAVNGRDAAVFGLPSSDTSPQAVVAELVTLSGTVESVSDAGVIVAVAGELPIEIAGRALSYAIEQGFVFHPGDNLSLTGFYEDQDFEVQALENFTTSQSLALREQNGRPLWAGGRGGGGGGGS